MSLSPRAQSYLSLSALALAAATAIYLSSSCAAHPRPGADAPPSAPPRGESRADTDQASPPTSAAAAPIPAAASAAAAAASATSAEPASAEPARAEPASRRYQVAAIGDSITDERSYPHAYMRQLREACPKSRWDNYGVGGNMVNQMRRRFDAAVLSPGKPKYTHLIVMGGVNDVYSDKTAGRTPAKIQRDLSYMYQRAQETGISVVGITVTPWGGFKRYYNPDRAAATHAVNAWIVGQVGARLDQVIDGFGLLSCGDPERLCEEYALPFKDGLHFGKAGHARLVEALRRDVFPNCE